ncbi:branched-chain amino acid ABC transporter permease [Variovorax defluvii]|uniref:Branched-chain amino acid ABC transporter permease n=1 Tax=Variovorax defluvii TaxID=913761 RepID=A0ABP8HFB2_9BURK
MATLLLGLSIGILLFLLAAGLTLIFGLLGIVNLAHGSLYMLGAYLGYQTVQATGSFFLALVVAPLAVAALGAAIEWAVFRRIYRQPHFLQFLLTVGVLLVIEEAVRFGWGLTYLKLDEPAVLGGVTDIAGVSFSNYRLFCTGAGVCAAAALFWALDRTAAGTILRAAQENDAMLASLGINVKRVRTAAVAVGAGVAAFAGVISAPLLPIEPSMGMRIILDCFVVVIIGGLGSIRGAIAASLLIGMTRAFGEQYFGDWVQVCIYGILVATLLVRPQGLFAHQARLS